ncbi:CocE/NonD family hydrolase [Catenulispora yoronensis]
MRDGTVLRADAYWPAEDGSWPVLLVRTPYGKQNADVLARLDPWGAARRGYLVVVQDCRGRFASDGVWEPLLHEGADGYDTIAWAARLPGADGRVGTYGPSYLGYTQQAVKALRPPLLAATAPGFTWADPDDGLIRRGGAYELGLVTQWTLSLGYNVLERRYRSRPAEARRYLADVDAALEEFAGRTVWERPTDEASTLRRLGLPIPVPTPGSPQTTDIPTLTVAGWFDCFLQGSLDNHVAASAAGAATALIVGPWSHDNQTSRVGEVDFGALADAAAIDGGRSLADLELDFFDHFLAAERGGQAPEGSALVFVMGADEWRRFPAWPPVSAEQSWYLCPESRLDRWPSSDPGSVSGSDTFDHDPDDPVPTVGGALLIGAGFPAGPYDQRLVEKRDDVLVYTSEPLDHPLEVVGRVRVHLVAESTAQGADWVARLCDVDRDGVSRNITDGVLRTVRTAGSDGGADEPDEYVIDLWSTAYVFQPGHRIRLQIAASCFPRWDRHPVATRARQTVHHGAGFSSRLVLPVLETPR